MPTVNINPQMVSEVAKDRSYFETSGGGVTVVLGVGVVPGSGDKFAIAPTATSVDADFLGITELGVPAQINTGNPVDVDGFAPGASLGAFSAGPAVPSEVIALTGVRFRKTTSSAGLTVVRVNRPV